MKVVARFDRAIEREGNIDVVMAESTPQRAKDSECGTIACHGGHYAVQYAVDELKNVEWEDFIRGGTKVLMVHYTQWDGDEASHTVVYSDGALFMARDLGFADMSELTSWADQNHELWGNQRGENMFCATSHAFTGADSCSDSRSVTLSEVRDHWQGVADRIKALG